MSGSNNFFEPEESHLQPSTNPRDNLSCTLQWANNEWHYYQYAYQNALKILIDYQKDNWPRQDYLLIPTLYLYQHTLEISIKIIIIRLCERYNLPRPQFDHRLNNLWASLLEVADSTPYKTDFSLINMEVQKLLLEIEKLDPSAFGFKYPEDKKTNSPYFKSKQQISINTKTMEELMLCFECMNINLDEE